MFHVKHFSFTISLYHKDIRLSILEYRKMTEPVIFLSSIPYTAFGRRIEISVPLSVSFRVDSTGIPLFLMTSTAWSIEL